MGPIGPMEIGDGAGPMEIEIGAGAFPPPGRRPPEETTGGAIDISGGPGVTIIGFGRGVEIGLGKKPPGLGMNETPEGPSVRTDIGVEVTGADGATGGAAAGDRAAEGLG